MQKRRPGRWPTRAGVGLICRNEDAARKWEPAGPEKRGRRRGSRTSDGGARAGGGGENGTETEVRVSGRSRVGGSGHPAVDDGLFGEGGVSGVSGISRFTYPEESSKSIYSARWIELGSIRW